LSDIVHRDLKLENILIKENVNDVERLEIKVKFLDGKISREASFLKV
jgi:serine/threonine protein kinase